MGNITLSGWRPMLGDAAALRWESTMGIRFKVIALIVGTALVVGLATGAVAAIYQVQTSNWTDTRETVAVLDSSAAALGSEQERLARDCGDWAPWDDSYEFVKHPTSAYVDSNLTDDTLVSLGIDFMVFVDTSGRIVYSKAVDPTTSQVASIPTGLVRYIATNPALLHLANPMAAMSGALSLPEGPYLIAAQPISKSDFSTAPDGTIVMGLRIGDKVLAKMQKITRQSMSVYSSTSRTLPGEAVSARASLGKPGTRYVTVLGKRTINAYEMVGGIRGEPQLMIGVSVPRTAYSESRSQLIYWGLGLMAFGIALVALLGMVLDKMVLRRLTMLSAAVGDIERSTDATTRIAVSGDDEIGSLGVGINRMLDELGRSQAEMAYLVDHDPLTGLYNRRYFENELRREIDEHQRLGAQGAILWFDLDHFKEVNDGLGHAVGDELLEVFGEYLRSETRSYCTVARLGGDEFGMLVPHVQGSAAIRAAVRLIDGFSSRTFTAGGHELGVSASAGVVLYPEHGNQTNDLLARADIAMYDAKARGGNQVVAYVPDDVRQTDMTQRLEASERILGAMREDRLVLYAQPMRSLTSDSPQCFELFLRMRDEHGELIFPADIIPTAERLGIIRELDTWVARRAIRLLGLARDENRDVQFAINLSGAAFGDATLLDVIRDEFDITGASPERLVIEITEATTIANMEQAIEFIRALRAIGCRFSLDDFGSQESSYYYLKHLPVDFLKIDGSLVADLATDSGDANFVHAIVEMCRGLQIQTVAEYVETEKSMDAASQSGVDFVQGFAVGKPEPLDVYLGDRFAESGRAWVRFGDSVDA